MNELISKRIVALMDAGQSLEEAFDAVLGVGSYKALAYYLHDFFALVNKEGRQ